MYEDLVAAKRTGSIFSSLRPCDEQTLAATRQSQPRVPEDYVEFLRVVGAGEVGDSQYTFYTGLVDPRDIYGDVPRGLERVVLFGDDMSGYCAGFDIATWKVVEVDPTNMVAEPVAESFEAFIRNRF